MSWVHYCLYQSCIVCSSSHDVLWCRCLEAVFVTGHVRRWTGNEDSKARWLVSKIKQNPARGITEVWIYFHVLTCWSTRTLMLSSPCCTISFILLGGQGRGPSGWHPQQWMHNTRSGWSCWQVQGIQGCRCWLCQVAVRPEDLWTHPINSSNERKC